MGEIGALEETRDRFVVRVVLAEGDDWFREVSHVVKKAGWAEWWSGVAGDLEQVARAAVEPGSEFLPQPESAVGRWPDVDCPPDDTWEKISATNAPAPRRDHTAVWTGSEMIVWGGYAGRHVHGERRPLRRLRRLVDVSLERRGPVGAPRSHRDLDRCGNDRLGRRRELRE